MRKSAGRGDGDADDILCLSCYLEQFGHVRDNNIGILLKSSKLDVH